jgi:hypothetical protein
MSVLRIAVLAVAGVVALSATGVRIGDHPAYVRVVVDFNGTVPVNQVGFDHLWTRTAALHIDVPGITTWTNGGAGEGVSVSLQPATQALQIGMSFAPRRFKYVSYAVVTGNRLAIDLWKSTPPAKDAEVRNAGCLSLRGWNVAHGSVVAHGTDHGLFENQFDVVIRGANGRVLGRRHVVGAGSWSTTVRYAAKHRQAGTLEAVDLSAKDGAADCLAQVRVTLPAS